MDTIRTCFNYLMRAPVFTWGGAHLVSPRIFHAAAGPFTREAFLVFFPAGQNGDMAGTGIVVLFGLMSAVSASHRKKLPRITPLTTPPAKIAQVATTP